MIRPRNAGSNGARVMNAKVLGRLLIVDDESAQMHALCETLGAEGYVTRGFISPAAALAALRPGEFDLLITDLMMPEMDGIALIAAVRDIDMELGAIVMTGHGTIDSAVQAMQVGALDYIRKPFRLREVLSILARALDLQRLRRENAILQERERRRSEELAAAYQELEAFSFSISHDLRSPLLFMKGFAQMLEDRFSEQLGEEGLQMLHVIRDGGRNMDQMIVGLLAFSKASRQPLRLVQLDMSGIVRAVVAEATAVHAGPPAMIDIAPLPSAAGDSVVIRHVWANLVGNALKYSSKRADPHIRISGRTDGSEVVYQIEDNGAGFDMRHADRLFGVFKRLHGTDEFAGTGVGLAIVQRIVTRHGGRVLAHGEPGVGARIEFTLPAKAPPLQEDEGPQL
jgi:two-component system, sensor histidine kinase and response regulator